MSAHDVRFLTSCKFCGELGDRRHMVPVSLSTHGNHITTERAHGRCYIEREGIETLLSLPTEDIDGLTLEDIGPDSMRAILDRHYPFLPVRKKGVDK